MSKLLPATYDFVFKYIFGSESNTDILKAFLSAHIVFDKDELDEVNILNPFLLAEYKGDKYGILDIKCKTKYGKVLDIEIQVEMLPDLDKRIGFYHSKMITEQVGSGDDYSKINPAIILLILAENLYDDNVYHHKFVMYDLDAEIIFSDLFQINVLELKKLSEKDDNTDKWCWGRIIKSNDEGELNMLAERTPEMAKAVGLIKHCSEDERLRQMAESYEKARMDQRVAVAGAREEGIQKGRQEGRREGQEVERNKWKSWLGNIGLTPEQLRNLEKMQNNVE